MCNLSQGIEDKGIEIGKAMGEAASAINKDIGEVEAVIEGKELEFV